MIQATITGYITYKSGRILEAITTIYDGNQAILYTSEGVYKTGNFKEFFTFDKSRYKVTYPDPVEDDDKKCEVTCADCWVKVDYISAICIDIATNITVGWEG